MNMLQDLSNLGLNTSVITEIRNQYIQENQCSSPKQSLTMPQLKKRLIEITSDQKYWKT